MEYVTLVVIIALFEYVFFTMRTGKARMDSGLKAPAVTGDEMFERFFRVQQNTLEQIVVFIPSIYICATYLNEPVAAVIGLLFIVSSVGKIGDPFDHRGDLPVASRAL